MEKYDFFICYKHEKASEFARKLEAALKTYAVAWWTRPRRVFRDENYVVPNNDLPEFLKNALCQSQYLILLASPDAARSNWVNDELQHWCNELGRTDSLVFVLTEGHISSESGALDWSKTDALPEKVLRPHLSSIPYFWDATKLSISELDLQNPNFQKEVNCIVARLLGIEPDEMLSAEISKHRLALRIRNVAVLLLFFLTLLSAAFGVFALQQRGVALNALSAEEAERQRSDARLYESNRRLAVSIAYQAELVRKTRPVTGLLLASEATNTWKNRQNHSVPEATRALRQSLQEVGGPGIFLNGHSRPVSTVMFSPSGRQLITASYDGTARVWDLDGEWGCRVLMGHRKGIGAIAISPNSRWLVTGSLDSTVRLWDLTEDDPSQSSTKLRHRGLSLWQSGNAVFVVAVSANGQWVATGSTDDSVFLWDMKSEDFATPRYILLGHKDVKAAAFSKDTRFLVTSSDETTRLWDLTAPTPSLPFRELAKCDVAEVVVSPDGRLVVTASESELKVFNLSDEDPLAAPRILPVDIGEVTSSAMDQNNFLVTGGSDHYWRLWDLADTNQLTQLRCVSARNEAMDDVLLSGYWMVTSKKKVWDLRESDSDTSARMFSAHQGGTVAAAISGNGEWLVTCGADATIRLWPLHSRLPERMLPGSTVYTGKINISEDRSLLVTDGDQVVRTWDLSAANPCSTSRVVFRGQSDVLATAVSRDNTMIAIGTAGAIRVFDLTTDEPQMLHLLDDQGAVGSLAFSKDNRLIVGRGNDVSVWELGTQAKLEPLYRLNHPGGVQNVKLSSDSRLLMTKASDSVKIWDLMAEDRTTALLQFDCNEREEMLSATMSANGTWLVTSTSNQLQVWNLEEADLGEEPTHTLAEVNCNVSKVAISPNSRWLVSGGRNSEARLWDLKAEDPSKATRVLQEHDGYLTAVSFAPDSSWFVTGGYDSAHIWSLESPDFGEPYTVHGYPGQFIAVEVSENQRWLVAGSSNHKMQLIALNEDDLLDDARRVAARDFSAREWEEFFPHEEYHPTFIDSGLIQLYKAGIPRSLRLSRGNN